MTPPQSYPAQPAAAAPPARVRTTQWPVFIVFVWLVVVAAAPLVLAKAIGTWSGWREHVHLADQLSDPSRSVGQQVLDALHDYHGLLPLVSLVELLALMALRLLALAAFALSVAVMGKATPKSRRRLALFAGNLGAVAAVPWLLTFSHGDNPPGPADVRTDLLTLVVLMLLTVALPVLAYRLIGPLAFQTTPIQSRPSAGWYDDPTAAATSRWWDGTGWTGFTS
jgi:hypothetical protein